MSELVEIKTERSKLRTAVYTFLICFAVAPPVGAIYTIFLGFIFMIVGPLLGFNIPTTPNALPTGMSFLMLTVIGFIGIPASYVYGGIPAAIGGILLGLYTYFFDRPPIWVPLAILAVPFLIPFFNVATSGKFDFQAIVFLGPINLGLVIAALVSWRVVVTQLFGKLREPAPH
jgi:hypothetical protein